MTTDVLQQLMFPRSLSGAPVTELPSARVPARTVMKGHYVQLEPLDAAEHAEALYKAGHENSEALAIWDYLAYGPWPDLASYTKEVRRASACFEPVYFAIRSLETGNICGQASYLDIQPENGVIEIGHIWFGLELQKTRAATEALYLMIRHAMDDLGYRRMEWRCNAQNEKSRRAAGRLGFRHEGVFYNHMIFKGKNRDTAWYSILDNEWPTVREVLEGWLSPDNFNERGQARSSLSERMENRGEDAWARG